LNPEIAPKRHFYASKTRKKCHFSLKKGLKSMAFGPFLVQKHPYLATFPAFLSHGETGKNELKVTSTQPHCPSLHTRAS